MDPRVSEFINKATVPVLRKKLKDLGLSDAGNKPELLVRIYGAVEKLSDDEISTHFENPTPQASTRDIQISQVDEEEVNHSSGNGDEDGDDDDDDDDDGDHDLNREIQSLREKIEKQKEILELKGKLSELTRNDKISNAVSSCFNFRDVEESLNPFSGDDNYNIRTWVQQFEDAAEVFDWNDKARFVYARRLFTGTAKLFLRTISVKSWKELKDAVTKEFDRKVTSAEVHNKLRHRKKKSDETWQQYLFAMQEIASYVNLDDADLIQYVINGINDSTTNKLILYSANTIQELKHALRKYEKIKSNSSHSFIDHRKQISSSMNKKADKRYKTPPRCYNCNQLGHAITTCPQPRREKGSCYRCGRMGHMLKECPERSLNEINSPGTNTSYHTNNFEHNIKFEFLNDRRTTYECNLLTLLDTGCSISIVQEQFLPSCVVKRVDPDKYSFHGINSSLLHVLGVTNVNVHFNNSVFNLELLIVKDFSMSYPVILGRNFMEMSNLGLIENGHSNSGKNDENCKTLNGDAETNHPMLQNETCCDGDGNSDVSHTLDYDNEDFGKQVLCIDVSDTHLENNMNFNINNKLPYEIQRRAEEILTTAWLLDKRDKSDDLINDFEMEIRVTDDKPFYCTPRRLPYAHRLELEKILNDLLERKVVRESDSPYTSPIVLVQKKNKEMRLCVDFRELNKITLRDNFPLPLIEDHLDRLKDKRYFSILDLKNGFHHVKIAENSVKYTSFITPLGQYEYLRMPFGLKNAPAVFEKFMKKIFKPLISSGKILSYIDDLLIATETIDEHIKILKQVIDIVVRYSLKLRPDKCFFLQEEITYLGYKVTYYGIQPNEENLKAIKNFPAPNCAKSVQSFLGLCSYFRRFIKDFASIAKSLYDLIKKDHEFVFGPAELKAFETLKSKLLESPVLAIYSPSNDTQLHCDASSIGFGAILLQKQKDGKFHPIAYFSKRTTEAEKNYHSYELETLSIIYALRRFNVYLVGIKFKIITDCQSLTLTLNKKFINPRISRWALELQNYDYTVEHRSGNRMVHADALSRSTNILYVNDESFEYVLAASQRQDPIIASITSDLVKQESSLYEMVDGLIYRKVKDGVRFYVPKVMENRVIQTHHEALCHLGVEKCYEHLSLTYWFPNMKQKITDYVKSCLKCAYFSPNSGKTEGTLHNIPKGRLPFDTLHIDHYGPLASSKTRNRHILVIIDAFTKFVKLYSTKSTDTKAVNKCLQVYFDCYSRPNRIVTDRATCFTSCDFVKFLADNNIQHIKIATLTPQANGQVERVNRVLTAMLAKECDYDSTIDWDKHLTKIEFALNNTVTRSTGFSPSTLLFGVNQKGKVFDKVAEYIRNQVSKDVEIDLLNTRRQAEEKIIKSQNYNKIHYDKLHKKPHCYKQGDLVMLKNNVSIAGVNKKLFSKFRGPYEVVKVLENDRYLVKDLDGMQVSRIPYSGVCSPANMKPFHISTDFPS